MHAAAVMVTLHLLFLNTHNAICEEDLSKIQEKAQDKTSPGIPALHVAVSAWLFSGGSPVSS